VKSNPSYPATDETTIDLGKALAGKTVRVRFRIGTAIGPDVGKFKGWQLDNISFEGITNRPFETLVADGAACAPSSGGGGSGGGDSVAKMGHESNAGCGCTLPGTVPTSGAGALAALAAALGLRARPRRSRNARTVSG